MFIYFVSQPNVSYSHNNTSMNTHSQEQHNKKRKNPTRRKDRCSVLFMNSVHIIMYNTSRSYLNGLIIIIIFFQ